MTRISSGGGGPKPPGGSESTESIQEKSKANEARQSGDPHLESIPDRQVAPDKYAAGDLKASGEKIKSQLDSQLETSRTPEQVAREAAREVPRLSPPYVPVGPVVTGDNIPLPASGQSQEIGLRSDQFQINEQGNLVITNEKLIDYFKALKEKGQNILLNLKPRGEE